MTSVLNVRVGGLTFQKAKGLEADVVLVLDDAQPPEEHPLRERAFHQTTFLGQHAGTYAQAMHDEARRLASVALTRARLGVMWIPLVQSLQQDGNSGREAKISDKGCFVLVREHLRHLERSTKPGRQPHGHPVLQPHEDERGGTATRLTLFRPATGHLRAKGVVSAPNAVLHPWLTEQLTEVLAEIEKAHPRAERPPEAERPACARWETWLGSPPRSVDPPLRIVLVLDHLAGHLSYDLVRWFCDHGVMPLSTPVGGSWLTMAESVQRIIVPRALNGQHPNNAQHIIDWVEHTVDGWNQNPTPCVWNGTRRRRRERARVRRFAGSGAALAQGYAIVR